MYKHVVCYRIYQWVKYTWGVCFVLVYFFEKTLMYIAVFYRVQLHPHLKYIVHTSTSIWVPEFLPHSLFHLVLWKCSPGNPSFAAWIHRFVFCWFSVFLLCFSISHIWGKHQVFVFLFYFTSLDTALSSSLHVASEARFFFVYYVRVIFHCDYTLHLYPLICHWALGFFSDLSYCKQNCSKQRCANIVSNCIYVLCSLKGHLEVELLNHSVDPF